MGLLTAAALMALVEERRKGEKQGLQKVSKKHTFILTHHLLALDQRKKLLRSIYLINVSKQSACPMGHHSLEVVSGFVVFIVFFRRPHEKSVEIPADSTVGSDTAFPQKEVVIRLKRGKTI